MIAAQACHSARSEAESQNPPLGKRWPGGGSCDCTQDDMAWAAQDEMAWAQDGIACAQDGTARAQGGMA